MIAADTAGRRPAVAGPTRRPCAWKLPKSSPAQKPRPSPDSTTTRTLAVALQRLAGVDDALEHRAVERVQLVGPVEADVGDAVRRSWSVTRSDMAASLSDRPATSRPRAGPRRTGSPVGTTAAAPSRPIRYSTSSTGSAARMTAGPAADRDRCRRPGRARAHGDPVDLPQLEPRPAPQQRPQGVLQVGPVGAGCHAVGPAHVLVVHDVLVEVEDGPQARDGERARAGGRCGPAPPGRRSPGRAPCSVARSSRRGEGPAEQDPGRRLRAPLPDDEVGGEVAAWPSPRSSVGASGPRSPKRSHSSRRSRASRGSGTADSVGPHASAPPPSRSTPTPPSTSPSPPTRATS